jgi:glycosyltransferase involved in cell wall biosynthesis
VEKIADALYSSGYPVALLGWDRTGKLPAQSFISVPGAPAENGAGGTERSTKEGISTPHSSQANIRTIAQEVSIPVTRIPLIAPFGHGLGNLPNLLRWQWHLFFWLARHHQEFDLIHACDFDTVFPALLCKWLWGKSVIYDIFDFYADHLRATPGWLKRIIRFTDLKAIGWADGLILADDSRWEQIRGANPRHSAVIYNSPASINLRKGSTPPKSPELSLRIAYIGLLQVERGLLEMLDVLKVHPEWHLDLAGFGGDETLIQDACQGLQNCQWYGRVQYDQALQLSQDAGVLFATYDPAIPNHRYSSPNKVFEAMMLAKPIIVARNTNMDRIIEQADCGIVVEYGDRTALASALECLQKDPELRQRLGSNGLRAYQTTYSWDEMEKRLGKLYAEVAGGDVS